MVVQPDHVCGVVKDQQEHWDQLCRNLYPVDLLEDQCHLEMEADELQVKYMVSMCHNEQHKYWKV